MKRFKCTVKISLVGVYVCSLYKYLNNNLLVTLNISTLSTSCVFVYCDMILSFPQLRRNLDKKDKKKKKKKDKKERKGERSRKDKKHKRKSSDSDEEDHKKYRYVTSKTQETPQTVDWSSSAIKLSLLRKTKRFNPVQLSFIYISHMCIYISHSLLP